jgi:4-carboxymuconolactone decarboxylase
MKPIRIFLLLLVFLSCLLRLNAQSMKGNHQERTNELSKTERAIVNISAFTTMGEMAPLKKALANGLNAGLTINEIKEILVQLYAYGGFPRSLNALNAFMEVLKERKQKGVKDEAGRLPNPIHSNKIKLEFGTDVQTKLVGRPVKGEIYDFAPAIDQFLKEHLFGDIFGRDNLDFKTREIATISALAALGGVENQLRSHFNVGMYNGLNADQLKQLVSILHPGIGSKKASTANKILQDVLKQRQNKSVVENQIVNSNDQDSLSEKLIFPKGEKINNNNFIGNAWLQQMILPDSLNYTQVGSVTFEPGARTNWHLHPGGQILLIMGGSGYYQEKGSAKKVIHKGDTIKCPPNVPHWHGATEKEELIQVAITNTQKGGTVWMQAVTENEYRE